MVLLVGSGLFIASFANVTVVDLGFEHRNVLTARVRLLELPADPQAAARRNHGLLLNVLDRIRAIPGVEVASLLNLGLPLRGDLQTVDLAIPGRTLPPNTDIMLNRITEDYFEALGIPLLTGRGFAFADTEGSPAVVILNQMAAERYFGGEDPIGKVVVVEGTRTVVGVAGNVRHDGPEGAWRTQAYVPFRQGQAFGATLLLRTAAGATGIPAAVREAIAAEFPSTRLPTLVEMGTLEARFEALVVQRRFTMLLLSLFGVLGVVIAAVGIYGVTAYAVTQRRREIGIRIAVGAVPGAVVASVLGGTSRQIGAGLAVGLAGAWSLATLVEGFLFQVEPHEPAIYLAVGIALLATGVAAGFLPARRAARVDPLSVLRSE
jgi:predicted permease